jgi:DNA polymerase sigma
MSNDSHQTADPQASELEREERRLERLRLVVSQVWPSAEPYDDDPDPKAAA